MSPASYPDRPESPSRAAGLLRATGGLLSSPRVRPVWTIGVLLFGLFAGFRAGLLIASRSALHSVPAGEIALCLLNGLRFDARVIACALLPMAVALALAPGAMLGRRGFRLGVTIYAVVLFVAAIGGEIVGTAFFLHFGSRFNWIAIDHFGRFRELAMHIWHTYPVLLFALFLVFCLWAMNRAFRKLLWQTDAPQETRRSRVVVVVVVAVAIAWACWGSLELHPLRQREAYFTQNNVVIQCTLNNVYTIVAAIRSRVDEGENEKEMYNFPPGREAREVARGMLVQPDDRLVHVPGNPLWRRTVTNKPRLDYNVVIIIMEGMSCAPVGALGNSPTYTPNLDALCQKGTFFNRMYAVGPRTSRGMIGILCGHPDLGGAPVLKRPGSQGNFLTLPGIFRRRGYRTMFIYGGDPEFDNMRGFFGANGMRTFISEQQMTSELPPTNWGMPDEIIFDKAHETFTRMGDEKFFAAILTVSNHEPYYVPPGRVEMLPEDDADDRNRRLNAYRYSDWALGEFFRKAGQAEYFKRTIFVLVADHGHHMDRERILDVPGYRVPCLIYAPGIVPARHIPTVASQADIAPTVLALLGGQFEHCFLGRNLLAVQPGDGFALLHQDNRLGFVRGQRALVLPPGAAPRLFVTDLNDMRPVTSADRVNGEVRRMRREMLSYYLLAWQLYRNGTYKDMLSGAAAAN